MNSTIASLKSSRAEHSAKRKKAKDEMARNASLLKRAAAEGVLETRILAHNGIIACLYGAAMFLTAYLALQLAFYLVALLAGSTGAYLMETAADVLTTYVILAMTCGFVLFFSFGIEKALMRAAKRRFWRKDRANGGIDKGDAWRERHPVASGDDNGAA